MRDELVCCGGQVGVALAVRPLGLEAAGQDKERWVHHQGGRGRAGEGGGLHCHGEGGRERAQGVSLRSFRSLVRPPPPTAPCVPLPPFPPRRFQKWVTESRKRQLDEGAENSIRKLCRHVARRRWRRAITLIRIIVRL